MVMLAKVVRQGRDKRKVRVTITINPFLRDKAKSMGINISKAVELSLKEQISELENIGNLKDECIICSSDWWKSHPVDHVHRKALMADKDSKSLSD